MVGWVCKREYFRTKDYLMQECTMHSGNSENLAQLELETGKVREVKGSHLTF